MLPSMGATLGPGYGGLPSGLIAMWSGLLSAIPSGWALCDGTNGTPNLLNSFVKGVATNATNPGATGGAATASYTPGGTVSQPTFSGSALGTHSHAVTSNVAVSDHASHTHTYTDVPNHTHTIQMQGGSTPATTGTHICNSTATGGSSRASTAPDATNNPSGGVATGTTAGPNATLTHAVTNNQVTSQAVSGGTPTGTVSQPTFTGQAASIATEPVYYALAFIMKL